MENFYNAINEAKSIVVALPTKPTFDQVAAGLAMQLALSKSKGATIYSPMQMTVEFNRLIGVDKISSELGNQNLVIKLRNYPGENVERVSADIENGEFYLTIIPKPGNIAPNKDQLDFSYSGISADLIILIGGANESHFPIMTKSEMTNAKFVHIGVRELQNSRNIMSVGRPASSDCEIAASVVLDHNFKNRPQGGQMQQNMQPTEDALFALNQDVATNLLMGIEDASAGFAKDSNADTFMIVSQLMRAGGTRSSKQSTSPSDYPQGAIPSQPYNQKPAQASQTTSQQLSQQTSDEEPPMPTDPNEPNVSETNPPSEWMKPGKIYKGTNQN